MTPRHLSALVLLALALTGCGTAATAAVSPTVSSTATVAAPTAMAQSATKPTAAQPTRESAVAPTQAPTAAVSNPQPATSTATPVPAFQPTSNTPVRLIVRHGDSVLIDADLASLGAAVIDGTYLPLTDPLKATWFTGYCKIYDACNQLLTSHRWNKTRPFNRIIEIKPDDVAELYTEDAVFVYKMTEVKGIKWSDLSYIKRERGKSLLTLETCDGEALKVDGVLVAKGRYVARGELVEVRPRNG